VMRLGETKEFIGVCEIGWGFETELLMNPAPFPSNETSQIEDNVLGSCVSFTTILPKDISRLIFEFEFEIF
jgi:hypothetical protein